jgi:hypothetical protein
VREDAATASPDLWCVILVRPRQHVLHLIRARPGGQREGRRERVRTERAGEDIERAGEDGESGGTQRMESAERAGRTRRAGGTQ